MFNQFLDQLRNTARLRWGIAIIIGIAWLYGVLTLSDMLQERSQQHQNLSQSLTRLRAQAAQTQWPARVAPAKIMAVQLESKLWQAATPGLAQAAYQDWLKTELDQVGISKSQVSVTVLEEDPENHTGTDLWQIRAKVGFESPMPSILTLLSHLETDKKQNHITALNVRRDPTPRALIELIGYFQKPATTTQPPKQAAP